MSYLKAGDIILCINFSSATILFRTCKIRIPIHSHITEYKKAESFQRNNSGTLATSLYLILMTFLVPFPNCLHSARVELVLFYIIHTLFHS